MIGTGGNWTLGTLIGMPIGVIITIGAVLGAYAAIKGEKRSFARAEATQDKIYDREYHDGVSWAIVIWSLIITSIVSFVVTAVAMFPYDQDYHRLRPVSGTVAAIDIKEWSSLYAITFTEGATVRCDDTRCATIKVGDKVSLRCTKEYQYGSTSGWGCRWGGKEPALAWKWKRIGIPETPPTPPGHGPVKPCQRPASQGCK